MTDRRAARAHSNLYYIFEQDKEENPMPEEKAAELRKKLEKIFKNLKPNQISNPPY